MPTGSSNALPSQRFAKRVLFIVNLVRRLRLKEFQSITGWQLQPIFEKHYSHIHIGTFPQTAVNMKLFETIQRETRDAFTT